MNDGDALQGFQGDLKEIHERLRHARVAAGYDKITDAALAIGVSPVTYTSHENGGRGFSPEKALGYAAHFGVNPAWILFGEQGGLFPMHLNEGVPTKDSPSSQNIQQLGILDRLHVDQDNAQMYEVIGDYMYDPEKPFSPGALLPGENVIIDTSDRTPSPAGTFAIDDGIGIAIRMIEIIPGQKPISVRITGRNPRYGVFERPLSDVEILGRVKAKVCSL